MTEFADVPVMKEFTPGSVTDLIVAEINTADGPLDKKLVVQSSSNAKRDFSIVLDKKSIYIKDNQTSEGRLNMNILHYVTTIDSYQRRLGPKELPQEVLDTIEKNGSIISTVRTRSPHSNNHITDMRAEEVFQAGVDYLSRQAGHPIGAIVGRWERAYDSTAKTNTNQYDAELSRLNQEFPQMDIHLRQQKAALTTWTGIQAKKLGYPTVHIVDRPLGIVAVFTR
jgi:hypothetical protein